MDLREIAELLASADVPQAQGSSPAANRVSQAMMDNAFRLASPAPSGLLAAMNQPAPQQNVFTTADVARQLADDGVPIEVPFGMPFRSSLYPGEQDYFRENPHVSGMAAEDGKVILNPYSNLDEQGRKSVIANEAARLYMRQGNHPTFSVTPEQAKPFDGTAYGSNPQALRETIAARIFAGDPSAGEATPEQRSWVENVLRPAARRK